MGREPTLKARYGSGPLEHEDVYLDAATLTLPMISYEHHEIHAGSHYYISGVSDLGGSNVTDLQFTTPNTTKWAHLTWELITESETAFWVYEGVTILTTATTSLTPCNNNRNSSNTSNMTLNQLINTTEATADTYTDTSSSTAVDRGITVGGKSAGLAKRSWEIVLQQNTTYLFRVYANAAGYVNHLLEWYEHTNKA